MHNYFNHPATVRKALLEAAAQKMGITSSVMEKDLWVTLTLQALFSGANASSFVFKGGTSLSKAYGIIERFSEDIDVTIDRALFGPHFSLTELAQLGRKERERTVESIRKKAHHYIVSEIIPSLETKLEEISKEKIKIHSSEDDPLSVEIYYPSFFKENYSYIKPRIYLEFGIRGELEPHDKRAITSYLHHHTPAIKASPIDVLVLSPIRTFYEKVTLIHQEANRSESKETPLRLSRHYYDVHQLALKDYLNTALQEIELLKAVINHKMLLFPSSWAKYDSIMSEGIKLFPSQDRLKDLRQDYQHMAEMFFGEHPRLEEILTTIRTIETEINKLLRE